MTRNRKLIAEPRGREEHDMKTRTDQPADRPRKSAGSQRRDVHRRPGHALPRRDGHSEVNAPRAAAQSDAQELTTQAGLAEDNASSDAAPLLLLVLAYATVVAFFAQLIIGS
jgi:hypothetical protein